MLPAPSVSSKRSQPDGYTPLEQCLPQGVLAKGPARSQGTGLGVKGPAEPVGGGFGKVQTDPDWGDSLGVMRGKIVCEIILEPGG